MNRRDLLNAVALAPAAAAQSGPADWPDPFAKQWHESFREHWRDTAEYTLAVLDAMPAGGFDTKPHPAQRTFGDQLRHLALANVAYFRALGLLPVPEANLPTARTALDRYVPETDKTAVRRFVASSFEYTTAVLDKMGHRDLLRNDLILRQGMAPHSGADICMRAYMHTAHHRGQAVVYLRVKGITPPAWKFEPSRA